MQTDLRKLAEVEEPSWADVSAMGDLFETQLEAKSGEYRHREWGAQEWVPGKPDKSR